MKKISIGIIMALCLLPLAFANTPVNGNVMLNWTNAYEDPQQFSGPVTGGLSGILSLTSNTDYDAIARTAGVTWSDNVALTMDETSCTGFYSGSNINLGVDSGTFTLSCADGTLIQGVLHGKNDAHGNMNLAYNAMIIQPIQGPQGDKGDKGDQGVPGPQGDQGIQGVPGSDANTAPLQAIFDASKNFQQLQPFWTWYNLGMQCQGTETKCVASTLKTCNNFVWNNGTICTYGCNAGACNPVPKDNCATKPNTNICYTSNMSEIFDYSGCKSGQGTTTSCNPGQCTYATHFTNCATKGCNATTGLCNK